MWGLFAVKRCFHLELNIGAGRGTSLKSPPLSPFRPAFHSSFLDVFQQCFFESQHSMSGRCKPELTGSIQFIALIGDIQHHTTAFSSVPDGHKSFNNGISNYVNKAF